MKSFKSCLTIILLQALFSFVFSASFAQVPSPQKIAQVKPSPAPAPALPIQKSAPAETTKPTLPSPAVPPAASTTSADKDSKLCDCLGPAINSIQSAYTSLEENEWPVAINDTKKTIDLIMTLSMDCPCPELIAYQNVADAYLKYAEGGNHLDTADEPNCPYATKLYASAISILDQYIQKISDADVKTNAGNIKDYLEEEKDFIDDECGDAAKSEDKPKSPAGSDQKKP